MRSEVAELFHILADLSPDARALYFAEHPVGAETRREVEELLAHDTVGGVAFTQAVAATAAQAVRSMDAKGARCGAFELSTVIGRGGMGVVYLAKRVDGEITQRAAVKLLHPGWSEVHRERFLQEREILAALTHPNIAHLLDAGHLDDGQPYFAMEYVEGQPIDLHCAGFSIRQKVELFLKVCGAVEYLHRNLVVHRDLKPSNILVTAMGEPKLLDFGIAKMVDLDGDLTATHLRMLTPNYASPEQLNGGVAGTSSDVYSLGAVLHTLLTGKPPQEAKPSQLAPELKGDLEIVLLTALRQEPHQRYASVGEFAGDLEAFLDSRPIRARQGDRVYRLRKLAQRYWVPAALIAALAATALSAGGLVWYRSHPSTVEKVLKPERLTANTIELPVREASISRDGKFVAYSDPLGIHLRDMLSGATRLLPGTTGHALVQWMPDNTSLQTRLRVDGQLKLMRVSLADTAIALDAASDPWVISPDRKLRVMASADNLQLLIQDADGGSSRVLWKADGKNILTLFQWSPRAGQIAIVSAELSVAKLEIIDVSSGSRTVLVSEPRKLDITSMVWPTPDRIIVALRERFRANGYNCNLWEIRVKARGTPSGDLRKLTAWTDFPIQRASLTTDGKRLVFVRSFAQRDVYVADIDAARSHLVTPRRLTLDLGDDYPTGWTGDSKTVLLASDRNGPLNIFRQNLDQVTAEPLYVAKGNQIIPRLAPDGKSVLFCDMLPVQRTCRLTRLPLAGGTAVPITEVSNIGDFQCSAAGACYIAEMRKMNSDYVVYELDMAKGRGREIYRDPDSHASAPDISPDGKWLATPAGNKVILRSFATGAVIREIPVSGATELNTLYYAPDGKGVFCGDVSPVETRGLYVDLSGRTTVLWRQPGDFTMWIVPSPDGRHLAMLLYTNDSNVYTVEDF